MQKTTQISKRLVFALAAVGFLLVLFVAAQPASARSGEDDAVAQTVAEQETETETESETESESAEDTERSETVKSRVNEARENAKKDLEDRLDGRAEMKAEKRQLVCENRQKAIQNKLAAFNDAADKHLSKFNSVYDKIQAYQEDENIQPADYDALVTAADAKKQAATDAVAALKEVAADVDCASPETVVKLGAVRDAAKETRTALHEYRMALKDLVVAIAQSKGGQDSADDTTNTAEAADATDTTDATDATDAQEAN
jgi:hypothetical protein